MWPDHGVPSSALGLIEFCKVVRNERQKPSESIIVHCRLVLFKFDILGMHQYFSINSAGVGRTGTFIALDIMMQRIKQERRINIFDLVRQLRLQRMKMVQTVDQYVFLYQTAVELIEARRQQPQGEFFELIF
jgi:protein tyrosine phosphatase